MKSGGETNKVELLWLGPLDETGRKRPFNAADGSDGVWHGLLTFDPYWDTGRVYVFTDREAPLDNGYATRNGVLEEVTDDHSAAQLITQGLTGMPTSAARGIIAVANGEVISVHQDGLY